MSAKKILTKMASNKRDWDMKSFILVAKEMNILVRNSGSTHFVFSHKSSIRNVTIPNHKDIHPDYVTQFLRLVVAVEKEKIVNNKN